MRGVGDLGVGDVAGFERVVGAAIGEKTAFAIRVDQRNHPPGLSIRIADEIRCNADLHKARRLALDVSGPDARDEIDACAAPGEPRRLIGCRAAGLNRIEARRSEARTTGPSGRTTTSVITSPMTRARDARKIMQTTASASCRVGGTRNVTESEDVCR